MNDQPSPYDLWTQAGGGTGHFDRQRYRDLLVEHGHLVPLAPWEKPEPLPCGWPGRRGADDPAPTTGAPYDPGDWPDGCICYLREDPDWGEVYTRPAGRVCPVHDCSCGLLRCRVHPTGRAAT